MKVDYPTALLEFMLSGLLLEIPLLVMFGPARFAVTVGNLGVWVAAAYALGLAANALATELIRMFVDEPVKRRTYEAYKLSIAPHRRFIEELIDYAIPETQAHIVLPSAINSFLEEVSEPSRVNLVYQNRLSRMARTVWLVACFWTLVSVTWLIQSFVEITVLPGPADSLAVTRLDLVFAAFGSASIAVALLLSCRHRISYIDSYAYGRLAVVRYIYERRAVRRAPD